LESKKKQNIIDSLLKMTYDDKKI